MEEILLGIGFNLEMRRLSRISRSNLELPDVSIIKIRVKNGMFGEMMVSWNSRDL